MILILLLIYYRYTATVTQYGKYHLFPSFSSPGTQIAECETDIKEISSQNQINSSSSNGFGILLNFCNYPSAFNVESQILELTSNDTIMNSHLKYNYTDFSQTPMYPVVINSYNHKYQYKITITCTSNSLGLDLRDKFRQYYLPCYFVLFIPMFIAAFRQTNRKNLRIACLMVFITYFLSIFFRYLSFILSIQSHEVQKKYVDTYDFIIASNAFTSFMRVFSWSILLTNCCHPVFVDKDFSIKNFSIVIFLLNSAFEIIDHIFYTDLFPYLEKETISKKYFSWLCTSMKNIQILYWSMYSIFVIDIIIVIIKVLKFLPKTKSKFIRRSIKGTMWLIIVCSFMLYISQNLAIYFAMTSGGFSCLTNIIIDTTDFFFPSLNMGAVYHFEKNRKYYAEKLRKRRERKNQAQINNNDKGKNKPLVDTKPLKEPATNYTQMNEPLLLNSTMNSFDTNNDLA